MTIRQGRYLTRDGRTAIVTGFSPEGYPTGVVESEALTHLVPMKWMKDGYVHVLKQNGADLVQRMGDQ